MPSYDYRCLATGTVHEVKHSLSQKATTWAELCALGNLAPGDIAPDSPVERLISAAGVVSTTKDATYKYGPYLKKSTLPAEPINNIATVEIVTTGTLGMTASGSTGGWKFDNKTGQLIANITAYQTR